MADVFTRQKRSEIMAAVRSQGNRETELEMVAILRAHRITGWRRHLSLPGKPDFLFCRERVALFVDGCFWHGCRLHLRMPQNNGSYWQRKIAGNVARDRATNRVLASAGWQVLRVWEHSLRKPDWIARRIKSVLDAHR